MIQDTKLYLPSVYTLWNISSYKLLWPSCDKCMGQLNLNQKSQLYNIDNYECHLDQWKVAYKCYRSGLWPTSTIYYEWFTSFIFNEWHTCTLRYIHPLCHTAEYRDILAGCHNSWTHSILIPSFPRQNVKCRLLIWYCEILWNLVEILNEDWRKDHSESYGLGQQMSSACSWGLAPRAC